MPHSGGGGSHGGGSYGSRSSSSSGFGGSGGGDGGRAVRTSDSYFSGARTFVYYRDLAPVFVYADSDLASGKFSKTRKLYVLFYIPFIIGMLLLLSTAIHAPKPIQGTSGYDIVIEDRIDALGDTSALSSSMKTFQSKTGITPAIVMVGDAEWKGHYDDLNKYAHNLYVNLFTDETHFLIVYSEPEVEDGSFVQWSYAMMEGDDTSDIFTDDMNDTISDLLHKNLLADNRYTQSAALSGMFTELSGFIMNTTIDWELVLTAMIFLLPICLHLFLLIFRSPYKNFKPEELKEVKNTADGKPAVAKCEYCGGLYVVGTDLQCPHCGAAVTEY